MPQGAQAVSSTLVASKSVNIVGASAGTQVKGSAGTFGGFTVNTAGTSSTLVAYDGTSTSGTKLGTWSTTAQVNFSGMNLKFSTGLFVVTTGTVSDITIAYA